TDEDDRRDSIAPPDQPHGGRAEGGGVGRTRVGPLSGSAGGAGNVTEALTGRFGAVHATALNMINMIGIGPVITIPLLMSALGGPQAMLGWVVALVIAAVVGILNVVLLYRRIDSIATITLSLWVGTLVTVAAVMATGALHFDARRAFDFPPGAFGFSLGFLFGLGAASRIGVYDYLGYYNVCNIGDEVRDPGRVIPRSILISTIAVAAIYLAVNLSVIGVVPWREFVPAQEKPASGFVVSIFMQRTYGPRVAAWFTLLILWTAFASVFALLLGYSRIPYAAAREGYFFKPFARLHPTGQ